MAKAKVKPRAKKKVLSSEERDLKRRQAAQKRIVRSTFEDMGFTRIPAFADKEFTYAGTTSDFDDVFVWENVVLCVEYTVKTTGHSEHLKKKYFLYSKILDRPADFFDFSKSISADLYEKVTKSYDKYKVQLRILYCTTTDPDESLKSEISNILFYDYPIAMYFKALSSSIKHSSRHEFLDYLKVKYEDSGENCNKVPGISRDPFRGSLLPDSHSNLGSQYKVVSFYISPEALLERAYVLRKEGWRDSDWLYQRLISPRKIESIREFLNSKGRVFLNNIIVTLPPNVKLVDDNDDTIDSSKISKTEPATIQLPKKFNSIGLIDGQHRVFSYHAGGKYEERISGLRKKLNLLVTGIMYPEGTSESDRMKFEAEIFLEINSNQTGAKSDLKQAIYSITTPYAATSVSKRVLTRLNRSGPLSDLFVKYFYDKKRLKTTSVISYGLRHLVVISNNGPLFRMWEKPGKEVLLGENKNQDMLDDFVNYCFSEINRWFLSIKMEMKGEMFEIKNKDGRGVLNTTTIIGFLNYLRIIIEKRSSISEPTIKQALTNIKDFPYGNYKSSQYGAMARDIYSENFTSDSDKTAR